MAKARGRSKLKSRGKKNGKKNGALPKKKPVKIDNAVPAICSECYCDFLVSSSPSSDKVTCPTCGHVGIVADDCFQEISERRQAHKKNFIIALMLNILALGCVLYWGVANSWPMAELTSSGGVVGLDENMNMILLGAAGVLLLGGLFMLGKYEKNRVEVYF